MPQEPSQPPHPNKSSEPKRPAKDYLRYSGLAFQMGITIGLFTYIGKQIDRYYQLSTPYGTVALALIGVFASLYLLMRDVFKP